MNHPELQKRGAQLLEASCLTIVGAAMLSPGHTGIETHILIAAPLSVNRNWLGLRASLKS